MSKHINNKLKLDEEIGKGLNDGFCKEIKEAIRKSKTVQARLTEKEKENFENKLKEVGKTETYVIRFLVSEFLKGTIKID